MSSNQAASAGTSLNTKLLKWADQLVRVTYQRLGGGTVGYGVDISTIRPASYLKKQLTELIRKKEKQGEDLMFWQNEWISMDAARWLQDYLNGVAKDEPNAE